MSRIRPISPGHAEDEQTDDILSQVETVNADSAFYGAIAHQPAILPKLLELFDVFPQSERITPELLELMRLKVAEENQCTYCVTIRKQAVEDEVSEKEAALFGDVDESALSREEVLAVTLAEQLARDPHRLSDDFFADLQAEFSDAEIIELIVFACIEIGLDRLPAALRLNTDDGSPYPTELEYPAEEEDIATLD